jgi:hypothetical protein
VHACVQGIRPATGADLSALKELLEPLERAGIMQAPHDCLMPVRMRRASGRQLGPT